MQLSPNFHDYSLKRGCVLSGSGCRFETLRASKRSKLALNNWVKAQQIWETVSMASRDFSYWDVKLHYVFLYLFIFSDTDLECCVKTSSLPSVCHNVTVYIMYILDTWVGSSDQQDITKMILSRHRWRYQGPGSDWLFQRIFIIQHGNDWDMWTTVLVMLHRVLMTSSLNKLQE